jgi:hypothetical protein
MGVGHELKKAIHESRKNINRGRGLRLIKATEIILEESRLIILDSQRLTFKG